MFCAFDIKSALADHLLQLRITDTIIASEVPFYYGFRRADMLFLAENKVHGFEIKSDLDKLDKLETQIKDYRNTFSYTWVVTTPKHLKNIRGKVPSSAGLIIINAEERIEILRFAKENKRLSKNSLIHLLSKRDLVALLKNKGKFPNNQIIDLNSLRELGEQKLTINELIDASYITLFNKYKKSYELFNFDRGLKTTHDDIYYLSGAK